ncbi:hypothetical protein [Gluconobacter kondonii]|uniref:hypothetical protein n=1 Tax=Gluconobacter kondonii TaxID=941463 RepID=UPI001B8D3BA5|nr:hypothetical protein [Gluconobacter kondonii]MBS1055102.1 hypothetical protein [Gluconobacter kondonii]
MITEAVMTSMIFSLLRDKNDTALDGGSELIQMLTEKFDCKDLMPDSRVSSERYLQGNVEHRLGLKLVMQQAAAALAEILCDRFEFTPKA